MGRALQGMGGGGLVPVTLAMVAARWPPDSRGLPLGMVGAVQELGSVIGPLYGAAIVAVASWRAIFWINVPVGLVLGAGFWLTRDRDGDHRRDAPLTARAGTRPDVVGVALLVVGGVGLIVGLDAPASLATSATFGRAWSPAVRGPWAPYTTPIVLVAAGVMVAFACWEAWAPPDPGAGQVGPDPHRPGPGRSTRRLVTGSNPRLRGGAVLDGGSEQAGGGVERALAWLRRCRTARGLLVATAHHGHPAYPTWRAGPPTGLGRAGRQLRGGGGAHGRLVDVPLFARGTVDPELRSRPPRWCWSGFSWRCPSGP